LGDCYAKDKQHIYEERFGELEGADYASFKTKSDMGCVAQDKNGYWFWNNRKAWKDMNSEEKERVQALQ
ncbi:MAG: DKNYY domain-containing protein, partial [Acinetobacter guillouiae]